MACLLNSPLRLARGLLLSALFVAGAFASAAESGRLEGLFACLESLGPELVNQFTIARADLETISAQAGWTADQKGAVTSWLDGLLPTETEVPLPAPQNIEHPIGQRVIFRKAAQPHHVPAPMEVFVNEFVSRLRALERLSVSLTFQAIEAVAALAENAWLDPSQPTKTRQALLAIERLRLQFPKPFRGGAFGYMRPTFPEPLSNENGSFFGDDAFTPALLLSGPEPLLLPAPEEDPAGYVKACLLLQKLEVWRLDFLKRSAVRRRLYDYQRRFAEFATGTRERFDSLILNGAPTEVLLQTGARLEACRVPVEKPMNQWQRMSVKTIRDFNTVVDYRNLLDVRPQNIIEVPIPKPALTNPMNSDVLDAYKAVTLALDAEKDPSKGDLSGLRSAALKRAHLFDPSVKAALETRWGALAELVNPMAVPLVAVKIAANSPPYEAVLDALRTLSQQRDGTAREAARILVTLWESVKNENLPQQVSAENSWQLLADFPGTGALFRARDRAVRQLLAKDGSTSDDVPLPLLLREKLERAALSGDSAELSRLLALVQACGEFPAHELQEWREAFTHIQTVSQLSKAGNVAETRRLCQSLLKRTTNPVIGESAARWLKQLPAISPVP